MVWRWAVSKDNRDRVKTILELGVPQSGASEPLAMGGRDPLGNTLGVNHFSLTRNGKPFFCISGEFHYARYPEPYWEEELLKIKAGGVNTVASYVFWMCHEEKAGIFDWRGDKNLRHFVALCGRHGLNFILRVGPFAHGEWRNGGLPDWLYGQPFEVRSNDPRYLHYVERFYGEIAAQVRGLFFGEGGPIIGVQIENEFMHAGAPWEIEPYAETEWITSGHDGVGHLKALKQMAERVGLVAPYYFATAWGGALVIEEETLPVYAEYAYPTWIDEPLPSRAYLFADKHAQPVDAPTHRTSYYPFLMAEQQGGIQVRYNNRPVVPPRSTEAMAGVNLGSGCNMLGYYMYHGGTTPRGQNGFLAERLHPQLSYDFQAPLGEYGQVRDSYRALKLIHLFLDAYGEILAPMRTRLPDDTPQTPTDMRTPRWAVRTDGRAGFLFVNQFQDHVTLGAIENVSFEVTHDGESMTIPEGHALTIPPDACFILPLAQSLEGTCLRYATAQPLTLIQTPDYTHYFYFAPEGIAPEYCFDATTLANVRGEIKTDETRDQHLFIEPRVGKEYAFTFTTRAGTDVVITTLTRREAEDTWKGEAWGRERVIVCGAPLVFERGGARLNPLNETQVELLVFPQVTTQVRAEGGAVARHGLAHGTRFDVSIPTTECAVRVERAGENKYVVSFPKDALRGVSDLLLRILYRGDTALAFLDGELIADNFCNGLPWEIGLKRFAPEVVEKGLVLVFRPLRHGGMKNVSSQFAARFRFEGNEKLVVRSIDALPEHRVSLVEESGKIEG